MNDAVWLDDDEGNMLALTIDTRVADQGDRVRILSEIKAAVAQLLDLAVATMPDGDALAEAEASWIPQLALALENDDPKTTTLNDSIDAIAGKVESE